MIMENMVYSPLHYKFLGTHWIYNKRSQQDCGHWSKVIECRQVCLLDRCATGNYDVPASNLMQGKQGKVEDRYLSPKQLEKDIFVITRRSILK